MSRPIMGRTWAFSIRTTSRCVVSIWVAMVGCSFPPGRETEDLVDAGGRVSSLAGRRAAGLLACLRRGDGQAALGVGMAAAAAGRATLPRLDALRKLVAAGREDAPD